MKELPTQLHNAMIDGLTMLLTLRLSGSPAADTVAATRKHGAVYWRTAGRGTKREMYRDFRRPLWYWRMKPTAGRRLKTF